MVYYTLDSSIPTEETGIRYEGETFTFNKVTVLRARAFDPQRNAAAQRNRDPPPT